MIRHTQVRDFIIILRVFDYRNRRQNSKTFHVQLKLIFFLTSVVKKAH
jgi:hypothetical protein